MLKLNLHLLCQVTGCPQRGQDARFTGRTSIMSERDATRAEKACKSRNESVLFPVAAI